MKTGCRGIVAQLPVMQEGRLAPAQEQQVRTHVEACVRCRGILAGLSLVERGLAADAAWEPAVSSMAAAAVRAAEARTHTGPQAPRSLFTRVAVPIAATAVLAVATAMVVLHTSHGHAPAAGLARPPRGEASVPAVAVTVSKEDLAPFQLVANGGSVGRAFVIRAGKVCTYDGPTAVRVVRQASGPPVLEVDAFPDGKARKSRHGSAAQRI